MLSYIVRRVVEHGYRKQNAFDLDGLTRLFAADSVFEFLGDTPFGGERLGRAAVRAWFEQVAREFGRLELFAEDVVVSGPPWNMRVIVRFTDRYRLIGGDRLENEGFQYLRLRWGKVKEDRILVNLDVLRRALELNRRSARESQQLADLPARQIDTRREGDSSPLEVGPQSFELRRDIAADPGAE